MSEKTMTGFKGFDKDLKCNGKQYEVGKTATHDGKLKLCDSGLHFCEHPLDVFGYYAPAGSRFAEVEAEGVSDKKDGDTKRVCKSLHIKAELTLKAMIEAAVKFTFDRADKSKEQTVLKDRSVASNSGHRSVASNSGHWSVASNSGDSSVASNSGDSSVASNSGDRSVASNSGHRSVASNSGKEGCAVALGWEGRASGKEGAWLTIAEWKEKSDGWHRVDVQTAKVGGKKIKADTFYMLKNGKFVEVE